MSALFFTSLLTSSEYLGMRVSETPLPVLEARRVFNVQSSVVYPVANGPQISLIVDDVGNDLALLEDLLYIPLPLTVSILPGARFDQESAEWAHGHGLEVMVHLPMEPEAFPEKDPGSNALLVGMNRKQLVNRTVELTQSIPHAKGVNNHMGSRLTARRHSMNVVMNVIARQGLFFIDSRTSRDSIAYSIAQQKSIPSAERTLFLDDPLDGTGVAARFEDLVTLARANGKAIGICHLKPQTLTDLRAIDLSRYPDVRFIFASAAVAQ